MKSFWNLRLVFVPILLVGLGAFSVQASIVWYGGPSEVFTGESFSVVAVENTGGPVPPTVTMRLNGSVVGSSIQAYEYIGTAPSTPQTLTFYATSSYGSSSTRTIVVKSSNTPPIGHFDSLTSSVTQGKTISAYGWAADNEMGSPITRVDVFLNGVDVANATLGGVRNDVANVYGRSDYTNSGWHWSYNTSSLPLGTHTVEVRYVDNQGAVTVKPSKTFTVSSSVPSTTLQAADNSIKQGELAQLTSVTTDPGSELTTHYMYYKAPGSSTWVSYSPNWASSGNSYWSGSARSSHTMTVYKALNTVGTWSFRSRGRDSGGRYSSDKYVDIVVASGAPSAPSSPSPSHNSTNRQLNQDISWSLASGATSYDIYFGTDSTPDSGEFKGNQIGASYDPGTLVAGMSYYWQVKAKNTWGEASSPVWKFTTGSIPGTFGSPSPANGSSGRNLGQDISWSVVSGATSYDVYFGKDSSPDGDDFKGNQSTTSYDPGSLDDGSTYYWKIVAVNDFGTRSSSVWSFSTGNLPGTPSSPTPASGTQHRSRLQDISWPAVGGATSYDVYFGTDSSPDSGEFEGNQIETSYSPGTLDYNKTYYWKIIAKNSYGSVSGSVWNFKTVVSSTADSDSDGMADEWEVQYGLDPTSASGGGNPDGDLFDNALEYLMGTDPTSATSPSASNFEFSVHRPLR